jgi:di/tricarboxylate transporter/CRP-like cAMP-binding protein
VSAGEEHGDEIAAQEQLIRSIGFLRDLDRVDVARLIGSSQDVHFKAGDVIVREGDAADSLYLLASGRVQVSVLASGSDEAVASIDAPATFGELGLLLAERTATVRAVTAVQAWRIPRPRFEQLVRDRPALGLAIARSLAASIDRRDRERLGAPLPNQERFNSIMAASVAHRPRLSRAISVLIAVGVPAVLWFLPAPAGLGVVGWHVSLVMLGGAIAWLLEPLPDFAVALAIAAVWVGAGLAPPTLAFSGFANSAWITAMAALGIAAAMAASGLLFRGALALMRLFPPTLHGQAAALLVAGTVLTPLMPALFGRVAAAAPVARELSQALGLPPRSRGSAAIGFAAILGNTVLGPIFLTGIISNFLVLGLLPAGDRSHFGWLGWLAYAAPAGLILFIGTAVILFALHPGAGSRANAAVRRSQERTLGRMSRQEVVSLVALGTFVVGLLLQQVLRLDIGVIALAALLVAIGGGALDRQAFRFGIDWATLVFFGVLLGAGAVLSEGGVDTWIADQIAPLMRLLGNPVFTVLILAVFAVAVRLVLPMVPAGFLLLVTCRDSTRSSGWCVKVAAQTCSANGKPSASGWRSR